MHHPHPLDKKLNREIMNRLAVKMLPARQRDVSQANQGKPWPVSHGAISDRYTDRAVPEFRPDALESFKELIATGGVELLAETYHHSLAFLYSEAESQR